MATLKHDILPANAPLFADDLVRSVQKRRGVIVDYSVASLDEVDVLVESFRQEGCKPHEIEATLFGLGCYVGAVFVRHARAKWRLATAQEKDEFGFAPLVLELGPKKSLNPIGKVIKRLENGEEDNLPYFFHAFT